MCALMLQNIGRILTLELEGRLYYIQDTLLEYYFQHDVINMLDEILSK